MPRPTKATEQVTMRLPSLWVAEAKLVAAQQGAHVEYTDVLREAIGVWLARRRRAVTGPPQEGG